MGHTVKEPYEAKEAHPIKEPYITTECDTINVIYKIDYGTSSSTCKQQECASYSSYCVEKNFWGNCIEYTQSCSSYKCVKYQKSCYITIKNKEREGAYFNLKLYKWDYDDKEGKLIKTDNVWVNSLDERNVYWDFTYLPTESVGCWYELTNTPQRTECEEVTRYKDKIEYRTVTKYRDDYKEKTETRYATLFEQITGQAVYYRKE